MIYYLKFLFRFLLKFLSIAIKYFVLKPFLFLIKPFYEIHFILFEGKIGPLSGIPECIYRENKLKADGKRTVYIFIVLGCENFSLLKILKRKLYIYAVKGRWINFVSRIFKNEGNAKKYISSAEAVRILKRVFQDTVTDSTFTKEEEAYGDELLSSLNIKHDDWFVCFHNRDQKYLNNYNPNKDWSYHDYRDCKIENFVEAMEHIVTMGGHAVRVGYLVDQKIEEKKNIVDYASSYRSELGDIVLARKCKLFVGNSSGLFSLASMFDIPVAVTNLIPYVGGVCGPRSLFIPKLLWSKKYERLLTMRECHDLGMFHGDSGCGHGDFYVKNELIPIENTADEIKHLCIDSLNVLENEGVISKLEEEQTLIKEAYISHDKDWKYFGSISPYFLRKHISLFKV